MMIRRADNVLSSCFNEATPEAVVRPLRGWHLDALAQQESLQRAFGNQSDRTADARTNAARVLLVENVHDSAAALLASGGFSKISQIPQALEGGALRNE